MIGDDVVDEALEEPDDETFDDEHETDPMNFIEGGVVVVVLVVVLFVIIGVIADLLLNRGF